MSNYVVRLKNNDGVYNTHNLLIPHNRDNYMLTELIKAKGRTIRFLGVIGSLWGKRSPLP